MDTIRHPRSSEREALCIRVVELYAGQLLAIARVESRHWYGTQYTALVLTNGDSPRRYIAIVRPDTLEATVEPHLLLSPDRRIVAVRNTNNAYMVLDPSRERSWAHEAIYELSPFLLLDENARPAEADVAQTLENIRLCCVASESARAEYAEEAERGHISGVPSAQVL